MGNTGGRGRGIRSVVKLEDAQARLQQEGVPLQDWEAAFRRLAKTQREDLKNVRIRPGAFLGPTSPAELVAVKLAREGELQLFRERTFRAIDSGDGSIDWEDFMLACLVVSEHGLLSEKLKLTFKLYETSNSSYVDGHDFWRMLEEIERYEAALESGAAAIEGKGKDAQSPRQTASSEISEGGKKGGADAKGRAFGKGSGSGSGSGPESKRPQLQLPPGPNSQIVREIFDRWDKDQDLKLSYLEFAQFLEESRFARSHLKTFLSDNELCPL